MTEKLTPQEDYYCDILDTLKKGGDIRNCGPCGNARFGKGTEDAEDGKIAEGDFTRHDDTEREANGDTRI